MGPAQHRVHALVGRAYRAACLACGAETVLVGSLGTLVALSAVAWQGAPLATWSTWGAALLAGLAGGGAWWLSARPARLSIARRIDASLGLDGALVTVVTAPEPIEATEAAADRGGLLVELLARRVGRRVTPAKAQRSAVPSSMPFLALPFLGATLLAALRAGDAADPSGEDLRAGVVALSQAMEDVERAALRSVEAGELDAEGLGELFELKARTRELASAGSGGSAQVAQAATGPDPEGARDLRALAERLRGDLEQQARERAPRSELARALDRAATRADALALAAGDRESGAGTEVREGAEGDGLENGEGQGRMGRGPVADASSGQPGARDAGSGRNDGERVQGDDSGERGDSVDERDGGRESQPEPSVDPARSIGGPSSGPVGVASGRWWTERDAAVDERWIRGRGASEGRHEKRDEDD